MIYLVVFLLLLEPLHFAAEALRVLPTLAYRGSLAIGELVVHGGAAALATAAALALINHSPVAARLATVAVVLTVARVVQSLYWTALPGDTVPGQHAWTAAAAVALGIVSVWIVQRRARVSQ